MGEELYIDGTPICASLHDGQSAGGSSGLIATGTRGVCVFVVLLVFVLSGTSAFARFSCRVGLYNTTVWSDNVYTSSTDPITDTYNQITPSVTIEHSGKRFSFYTVLSVSRQKYRKLDELSRDSMSASLYFSYALSSRTVLTFENAFNYAKDITTQTTRFEAISTEAGVINQLVTRGFKSDQYINNTSLTLKHNFNSRTELVFRFRRNATEHTHKEFDDSSTTAFEASVRREISRRETMSYIFLVNRYRVNDDEVDALISQFRLIYSKRMSSATTYNLEASVRNNRDTRGIQDTYYASQNYMLYFGVKHKITRQWTFSGKIGYVVTKRSGDIGSEVEAQSAGSELDISFERVSPVSTMYVRMWQTLGSGTVSSYDTKSFLINYSRNLNDKLSWDCMLSYANNTSADGEETDTVVFSTGLFWYINDDADVSLRFVHSKQTVDDEVGSEMKRNTLELSINLRYKIKR